MISDIMITLEHAVRQTLIVLNQLFYCIVVIPGLFVRLMSKVDAVLQPSNLSYFNVAMVAYAVGLMACFGANEIFHNGQPALFYLDPSLIGSSIACAAVNNQVPLLWRFKEEEDAEEESQ